MRYLAVIIIILSMTPGCAGQSRYEDKAFKTANPFSAVLELQRSGRYLEATYYLEALIKDRDDEIKYLPLLIESQVRSHRLLASLESLLRLRVLQPDNRAADELYYIIKRAVKNNLHAARENNL